MLPSFRNVSLPAVTAGLVHLFVGATTAFAQFAGPEPDIAGTPSSNNANAGGIRTIITNVLIAVLNFLALAAVVVVVVAGIRLVVSQGEEEVKEKAKKTITYALVGLVIVLLARVIVGLVTNYLASQV